VEISSCPTSSGSRGGVGNKHWEYKSTGDGVSDIHEDDSQNKGVAIGVRDEFVGEKCEVVWPVGDS
jgi:hypothetical protein